MSGKKRLEVINCCVCLYMGLYVCGTQCGYVLLWEYVLDRELFAVLYSHMLLCHLSDELNTKYLYRKRIAYKKKLATLQSGHVPWKQHNCAAATLPTQSVCWLLVSPHTRWNFSSISPTSLLCKYQGTNYLYTIQWKLEIVDRFMNSLKKKDIAEIPQVHYCVP